MKANTNKSTSRVSPLSSNHSNTRQRLSHPRVASDAALIENSRLFASQPVDGQGALCSQVSETQYFMQFDADIDISTCLKSLPSSPRPESPLPESPIEDGVGTPQPERYTNEHWPFWDWHKENSWDDDATIGHSPATSNDVSLLNSDVPAESKPIVKSEPKDAVASELDFTHLSDFEKWVIGRIRESGNDGIRLSTRLPNMKKRLDFLDGMQLHYKRLLGEIHMLSRDLF
ncbi:hypothetical protein K438DRAFT_1768395 [Mycena galopus ATCC 62051]|nr:hypothetical protein K438DRAFT_1768395 [Mycena galopus ATCC 62051]